MKVIVCVDVWDCTPRAFLTADYLPTNEVMRLAYLASGRNLPRYGEDIYPILSEKEKEKVDKIAEPINISGIRGTIQVSVPEKNTGQVSP